MEPPSEAAAAAAAPPDHVVIVIDSVLPSEDLPDAGPQQRQDQQGEGARAKQDGQKQQEQQQEGEEQVAGRECRICLAADNQDDMLAPCSCSGTVRFAHKACLKAWISERQQLDCELCSKPYRPELLPELQPLVDAAAAAAAARRRSRRGPDGLMLAGLGGLEESSEAADAGPQPISWTRFWVHLSILVMLLVAVLYLALFVPISATDNFWLMFLWRAITVILPLFLIIRCVAALYAWRRAYVAAHSNTGSSSGTSSSSS